MEAFSPLASRLPTARIPRAKTYSSRLRGTKRNKGNPPFIASMGRLKSFRFPIKRVSKFPITFPILLPSTTILESGKYKKIKAVSLFSLFFSVSFFSFYLMAKGFFFPRFFFLNGRPADHLNGRHIPSKLHLGQLNKSFLHLFSYFSF